MKQHVVKRVAVIPDIVEQFLSNLESTEKEGLPSLTLVYLE